ncbi:MAG: response regulator, partial [bacterium]|nr:response regulator [bacterium]
MPKKILIVDDDRVLAELLGTFLQTFGYPPVCYAGDGLEGLFCLEQDISISLIFTDKEMPNMEGPEFIKQCRSTYPGKKIIYMSGTLSTDDDLIAAAKEVGADAAIPKPFLPHK